MKKIIILAIALFAASCVSCNKEDEDWTPYPGGTGPTEQPKS